jgi:hypothetical protein
MESKIMKALFQFSVLTLLSATASFATPLTVAETPAEQAQQITIGTGTGSLFFNGMARKFYKTHKAITGTKTDEEFIKAFGAKAENGKMTFPPMVEGMTPSQAKAFAARQYLPRIFVLGGSGALLGAISLKSLADEAVLLFGPEVNTARDKKSQLGALSPENIDRNSNATDSR